MEPEANVEEQGATSETTSESTTTALTVEGLVENLLPHIDRVVNGRVQAHSAALFQGLQSMLDKGLAQIQRQYGVDKETAEAMKAAAKLTLGDEAYADLSTRTQQDRQVEELRQQLEELRRQQQPTQQKSALEQEWDRVHFPELQEHCADLGLSFDDVRKRMGVKTIEDFRDGFLGWKREFRRHANAMAGERQKAEESAKTKLDTTRGSAPAPRDYSGTPIREISDEDFTKNFADIVAATVAKNRR